MPIFKEEKETPKTKKELEAIMKKEHLVFCREYVLNGKNGTQAYMTAYKKTEQEDNVRISASKFLTNSNITAYISLLKEEVAKKYDITVETQLRKIEELFKMGTHQKDVRASLACLQEESKLVDLYAPEKKEVELKGSIGYSALSTEELLKLAGT